MKSSKKTAAKSNQHLSGGKSQGVRSAGVWNAMKSHGIVDTWWGQAGSQGVGHCGSQGAGQRSQGRNHRSKKHHCGHSQGWSRDHCECEGIE